DFELDAAQTRIERRAGGGAEMKVSGHQRLRRQTAGHGDDLDIQSFVLIEAQLLCDKVRIINRAKARKRNSNIFALRALRTTGHRPNGKNRQQRISRSSKL